MEGNQQKMREAVVALLDAMESLGCDESTATLAAFVPDMADSSARCLAAFRKAKEALSAPARNCDLKECSSDDGMISAHERFCESWHDDGKSCAVCPHNPKSYLMTCREKWLLAPAAERKGEGDENK